MSSTQFTSLTELAQHAKQSRGLSGRALAALANDAGHTLTHTTLNAILAGTYHWDAGPETIRALAWLADVPEAEAFEIAGARMPGPSFADSLPPGVDYLSARGRRTALAVIRALMRAEELHGPDTDDPDEAVAAQNPT